MAESISSKPRAGDARSGDTDTQSKGIVDKLRQTATSQLTDQKNRAVDGLGSVTQAVRQTTQQLRDQNHDTIAGYVDQAAGQIERLSQQLRDRDITELFADLQRLSRRQPAIFIGGAFALGFMGARFLKSGTDRSYGDDRDWRTQGDDRGDEYRGYARAGGEMRYGTREVATVHDYGSPSDTMDTGLNTTADTAESSGQSADADTDMNAPESGSKRSGGRSRRSTQTERP
jgi:hypothetical protein